MGTGKAHVLILLSLLGSVASFARGDEGVVGGRAPRADRALLARIATETSVAQSPPQASLSAYATDVLVAAFGPVRRAFRGWLPNARYLRWLALALLGSMVGALAWVFLRAFLERQPRRSRRAPVVEEPNEPGGAPRHRDAWRDRVRELLREGDVAGALVALWFYFAHSIGSGEVDPSWTTRELLERRGRRDLAALGGRLERLQYGPLPAVATDVSGLLGEMDGRLS